MFGIGFQEFLIIGVVLLLAVGPNRLPQLFKSLITGYREIRKATRELRASTGIDQIMRDEDLKDLRKLRRELKKPVFEPTGAAAKPETKPPANTVSAEESSAMAENDDEAEEEEEYVCGLNRREREQECPEEGVDVAESHDRMTRLTDEAAQKIIAAKEAAARSEADVESDGAPTEGVPTEKERAIIAAKEAARVEAEESVA